MWASYVEQYKGEPGRSGDASKQERSSGVLLHVTSLPSYGGVGDFVSAPMLLCTFRASKQRLLAGPSAQSHRVTAARLIRAGIRRQSSADQLGTASAKWLDRRSVSQDCSGHDGPARLRGATRLKLLLIEEAARNFLDHAPDDKRAQAQRFCKDNISGCSITRCSMCCAAVQLRELNEWPQEYAQRKHDALTAALNRYGRELAVEQVIQFFFNEQWCALSYRTDRKIRVLGDVAIFVSYDSADVWTHPGDIRTGNGRSASHSRC